MSKTQKEQTVTVDDKTYNVSDLNETQITLVNHVADLERKMQSAKFNLDQLQGGYEYFLGTLRGSLEENQPITE
jgi:hypothetical protein